MFTYNPTFKAPTTIPIRKIRSPSPPRAFVEPLSPPRPRPIEPIYNYPAINNNVDYTVRPDQSFSATPKLRKNGHHRSTSTIEQLAEAALATSPSYPSPYAQTHSRRSSTAYEQPQYYAPYPPSNGASEPLHKRVRSELLPSPLVGQYASRPATSYEHINDRPNHGGHPPGYDSRVEEAALLLNFRTQGWDNSSTPFLQPAVPTASRPHANSFPQDAYHARPTDTNAAQSQAQLQARATLLPPFTPQQTLEPRPMLPSPQRSNGAGPSPHIDQRSEGPDDVIVTDACEQPAWPPSDQTGLQVLTPSDDPTSRAQSSEVSVSGNSDAPMGKKRGWPKGKPRGVGAKNAMAKAATKRAAGRKKTSDSSKARKKSVQSTAELEDMVSRKRRNSLSQLPSRKPLDTLTLQARALSVPRDVPMQIRQVLTAKSRRHAKAVTDTTICAGCSITRETATSHGEMDEWISCNGCKKWFHIDCAGFAKAHEVKDVDKYFCAACEPTYGKTNFVRKSSRAHASVDYAELQRGVLKTSEESPEHHYIQSIKDGTFQFDEKEFRIVRPETVTREIFERSDIFNEPICIPAELNPRPWEKRKPTPPEQSEARVPLVEDDPMEDTLPEDFEYELVPDLGQDKLDMVMPEGLTVRQVCKMVGHDYPLDVIDVKTQNSGGKKWNLGQWADYYEAESDDKPIRNVISLEVSQTKLGRLLQRPKIVRDIDLQDDVWPQEEKEKGKWPRVQFYCLMSVADSYTDFHIDFGGSSVYYHILKGKKTFFFIPPKPKHLKAYEEWNDSQEQNYTFLPSVTKECYRVDLKEGDTMLIPSGWIHAVWTPETSLVIGGNFLTRMSFQNQFKVVEVEQNNHTPLKFRYPFFQRLMFYTVLEYLKRDPLPQDVDQLLQEGKRFERQVPIYHDFDGDLAANDPRPGGGNARYYSQAEIEGLPELVNYILRIVMMVLGRVDGVSQDRMKRMNTGIPKNHSYGDPLDLAKKFAFWAAWKTGKDLPSWALQSNAELLNTKEEGPPKKLSVRAMKAIERREVLSAVPRERTSTRKIAPPPASANGSGLVPLVQSQPPIAQAHFSPSKPSNFASSSSIDPSTNSSPLDMLSLGMGTHYVSTPKTSVLGPKRVACDTCRRRRIKCKHKDMVTEISFGTPLDPLTQSHFSPDLHDKVEVQPRNLLEGSLHSQSPNGASVFGSEEHRTPQPGTNTYLNTNIPMAMNGVTIFGEPPKKSRSKACDECRKSKRRCVHDDNGEVDPVKAAETPVPRGAKRQSTEEGSPQTMKKHKTVDVRSTPPTVPPSGPMQGVIKTAPPPPRVLVSPIEPESHSHISSSKPYFGQGQPPLDPSLFNTARASEHEHYHADSYHPYPTTEHPPQFELQSLEQIANEVLDMNGRSHEDYANRGLPSARPQHHVYDSQDGSAHHDGLSNPDGSVDSAVSLPGSDTIDQKHGISNADTGASRTSEDESVTFHGLPEIDPSAEMNDAHAFNGLPLYHPPAPVTQSPELRRQYLANGYSHRKTPSLELFAHPTPMAPTPGSAKRTNGEHISSPQETEDEKFARLLQQETHGLRRRS